MEEEEVMSFRTYMFGDKRYSLHNSYDTKSRANKAVEWLREKGWNARIVERDTPTGIEYYVYKRRREKRKKSRKK